MTITGWAITSLIVIGLGATYKVVFDIKIPKRRKK